MSKYNIYEDIKWLILSYGDILWLFATNKRWWYWGRIIRDSLIYLITGIIKIEKLRDVILFS